MSVLADRYRNRIEAAEREQLGVGKELGYPFADRRRVLYFS